MEFVYNIQRIKKKVFALLLQCQIKWPLKGQSNQQEHVHCVLPAETQWEVTNLWLTVQEIEDRNPNASYAEYVFQITQCLANFWIFESVYCDLLSVFFYPTIHLIAVGEYVHMLETRNMQMLLKLQE